MASMKYLPEGLWERLNFEDYRPRFFIETYIEKLCIYTPHFSQSRLMNVFSGARETLEYIQDYVSSERNSSYILSAVNEIDSCIKLDPVAQEIMQDIEVPLSNLFSEIRKEKVKLSQLTKLRVICNVVLSREDAYASILTRKLRSSIFDDADIEKKGRITEEIYTLTGLYTTFLLNRGYSPTYLFNRTKMFTKRNNYQGRSVSEQFDHITERLQYFTIQHDVFFSLSTNMPDTLLTIEDDSVFTFAETIPDEIQGDNRDKLSQEFDPNVIVSATITTTDHISASWSIKSKLDKILDSVTALEFNPKIQISSHCVTIARHQELSHPKAINISYLLGFLTSENGTHFSAAGSSIRHCFRKLNDKGTEQLSRSLRYLRLA